MDSDSLSKPKKSASPNILLITQLLRKEDSLRDAIGNWLYTKKFGAWRNTNKLKRYKESNQELWGQFRDETQDYSMRDAINSVIRN